LEVVITSGWTTTATKKEKQPRLETEVGGKIDSHGTIAPRTQVAGTNIVAKDRSWNGIQDNFAKLA
jgi:hypothetical protein